MLVLFLALSNSSGTLAYSGPTTRSKADTGFVIRSGVANKISGVAINPILSGGSDTTSRKSGNIAYRAAYHSKGLLSGQIFNLYRDPTSAQPYRGGTAGGDGGLRQDDNTAKSGISGWGTSRALAADSAAVVGFGAAPKAGEFYILQNFVSFTGTSISGDGLQCCYWRLMSYPFRIEVNHGFRNASSSSCYCNHYGIVKGSRNANYEKFL